MKKAPVLSPRSRFCAIMRSSSKVARVRTFEFAAEIGGLRRLYEKYEGRSFFPRLDAEFDEGNAGLEIIERSRKGGVELGAIACLKIEVRQLDLGLAVRDDGAAAVELIRDIENVLFPLIFGRARKQQTADL